MTQGYRYSFESELPDINTFCVKKINNAPFQILKFIFLEQERIGFITNLYDAILVY